ncbi:hypothetical protein SFC50_23085 [Bacillus infantis]
MAELGGLSAVGEINGEGEWMFFGQMVNYDWNSVNYSAYLVNK